MIIQCRSILYTHWNVPLNLYPAAVAVFVGFLDGYLLCHMVLNDKLDKNTRTSVREILDENQLQYRNNNRIPVKIKERNWNLKEFNSINWITAVGPFEFDKMKDELPITMCYLLCPKSGDTQDGQVKTYLYYRNLLYPFLCIPNYSYNDLLKINLMTIKVIYLKMISS